MTEMRFLRFITSTCCVLWATLGASLTFASLDSIDAIIVPRAQWERDTLPTDLSRFNAEERARILDLRQGTHHHGHPVESNLGVPLGIVFHHTAGSTSASSLGSIVLDHMVRRGWEDVGYHFLIAQDSRGKWKIYEGRKTTQRGSHVEGFNEHNLGIVIAGNYKNKEPEAEAQKLAKLLVSKLLREYPSIQGIYTHSDASEPENPYAVLPHHSDCPGKCWHMVDRFRKEFRKDFSPSQYRHLLVARKYGVNSRRNLCLLALRRISHSSAGNGVLIWDDSENVSDDRVFLPGQFSGMNGTWIYDRERSYFLPGSPLSATLRWPSDHYPNPQVYFTRTPSVASAHLSPGPQSASSPVIPIGTRVQTGTRSESETVFDRAISEWIGGGTGELGAVGSYQAAYKKSKRVDPSRWQDAFEACSDPDADYPFVTPQLYISRCRKPAVSSRAKRLKDLLKAAQEDLKECPGFQSRLPIDENGSSDPG